MHILVCDDDCRFAQDLTDRIQQQVRKSLKRVKVDCITDPAELPNLPLEHYDIAFLDIDMYPFNGIAIARRLHEIRRDMVLIFVTNYVEYSIEGYEVQAFRYLLKSELDSKLEQYVSQAITVCRKVRDTIRLYCEGEDVDLKPKQIMYAEVSQKKVILHLTQMNRTTLTANISLSELEEALEERGFVRVHKAYLVNMAYIKSLQSNCLYLTDDTRLKVSTHNASQIRKTYVQWRGRNRWIVGPTS